VRGRQATPLASTTPILSSVSWAAARRAAGAAASRRRRQAERPTITSITTQLAAFDGLLLAMSEIPDAR
jgi:hypothetical protein